MLCTPNHKRHSFKATVFAKYLTRELGYEPLGPRSDKHLGKLFKRDEARRLAEYTVCICPTFDTTGKSELVGQCAILRNGQKAEVPVFPLKGKFWESSEIYQHHWQAQWGRQQKLILHIAGESTDAGEPVRLDKVLNGQGLGSARSGP